jgi:hypothetical protein
MVLVVKKTYLIFNVIIESKSKAPSLTPNKKKCGSFEIGLGKAFNLRSWMC